MEKLTSKDYCPHCNIRMRPLVTGEGVTFYTCPGCRRQRKEPKTKRPDLATRWREQSEAALKLPAVRKLFDDYMAIKREAKKAHFEITRQHLHDGLDRRLTKQKHNEIKAKARAAFNAYQSAVWKLGK